MSKSFQDLGLDNGQENYFNHVGTLAGAVGQDLRCANLQPWEAGIFENNGVCGNVSKALTISCKTAVLMTFCEIGCKGLLILMTSEKVVSVYFQSGLCEGHGGYNGLDPSYIVGYIFGSTLVLDKIFHEY